MNQMQGMLTDYVTVKEEAKEFSTFESSAAEQQTNQTFDFTI
jgi:hypothetical protein